MTLIKESEKEQKILKAQKLLKAIDTSRIGIIPIVNHLGENLNSYKYEDDVPLQNISIYSDHECYDLADHINPEYLQRELRFRIDSYLSILNKLNTVTNNSLNELLMNNTKNNEKTNS